MGGQEAATCDLVDGENRIGLIKDCMNEVARSVFVHQGLRAKMRRG